MHVTQQSIHSLLKQPNKFGNASMCPCVFQSLKRSQKSESNTVNKTAVFIDSSNKQIDSDLSYLGMT